MRVHRIAIGWWEPFPIIKWILDQVKISEGRSISMEDVSADEKHTFEREVLHMETRQGLPQNEILARPCGKFEKGELRLPDGSEPSFSGDYSKDFRGGNDSYDHPDFTTPTIVELLFGTSPYEGPSLNSKETPPPIEYLQEYVGVEESSVFETDQGLTIDSISISKTLKLLIDSLESTISPEPSSIGDVETKAAESSTKLATNQQESAEKRAIIRLNCQYKSVQDAAKKCGMIQSNGNNWDVLWSGTPIPRACYAKLMAHQRVNLFPETAALTRKNNLGALLKSMSNILPAEYDFYPESWSLPKEWMALKKYVRTHSCAWIIAKPHNGKSGIGIFLTQNVFRLRKKRGIHCQVYIQKPLLINGLKFDLRMYVLLTSCKPLRIYVYNEGLARFATVEYREPNEKNKHNFHMHLTNYFLNRASPTYVIDETRGTLRRFSTILDWLNKQNVDVNTVTARIDDIIIKTVIAMLPTLQYNYYTIFPHQDESMSSFQIFGFDILLDRTLKPYVLEVNKTPCFYADVPLDIEMTDALIFDTFNILNLSDANRSEPTSSKERIEWENSHLGNYRQIYPNDRMEYYKELSDSAEKFILMNPE